MPDSEHPEERSVSLDEIKAGIHLRAGHSVVLVVDGLKGTPAPKKEPPPSKEAVETKGGESAPAGPETEAPQPPAGAEGGAEAKGPETETPPAPEPTPEGEKKPEPAPEAEQPPEPAPEEKKEEEKKEEPGPKKVTLIELEDVHFRFDSAVFLPEPAADKPPDTPPPDVITGLDALKTILIHVKEAPDQRMLVTGHTDTKGPDAYNQGLSEQRAAAALSLIQGDREAFAAVSQAKHQNKDVQQILDWAARVRKFDCSPGKIDGDIGSGTQKAIKKFKQACNAAFNKGLNEKSTVDLDFWRGSFDLYQDELSHLLDEEDASGLDGYRGSLKFVDDGKKSVGCGEKWPIEEAGRNEFRSATNRRIEVLFFDPDELPPLDCHPAPGKCDKAKCVVNLKERFEKNPLPVHPHARPQSKPTILVPARPGSATRLPLEAVVVYLATYTKAGAVRDLGKFRAKAGKLTDFSTGAEVSVDCDRDVMIYCSHRTDLDEAAGREARFARDRSGLPLVAAHIPCGDKAQLELDIWAQADWVLVGAPQLDGKRVEKVTMAAWREDYKLGKEITFDKKQVFNRFDTQKDKEVQEFWIRAPDGAVQVAEVDLVRLDKPGPDPLWVGTLSALPQGLKACKVFLVSDGLHAGSFNELKPGSGNLELLGHHTYDLKAVQKLLAIEASSPKGPAIDPLPSPPARFLLPGDICWHDQGQTNNCGAFSLAAAMNYWKPFTNNPKQRNGSFYNQNIPTIANGARTPANLVDGANKFGCDARDNDLESTDRAHALKLLKNWVMAGVPVAVLVQEASPNIFDLVADFIDFHWKVVVGWDGNRFFLSNSGGDRESADEKLRKLPADRYHTAPVGSDVDGETDLYDKWHDAGGMLSDAFTSIDRCTFIPLFPKGAPFASDKVR